MNGKRITQLTSRRFSNFTETTKHKLEKHFANSCKCIQLRNIRLELKNIFLNVYIKCTGRVGPLTIAIEDKSLRVILV